MGFRPWRSLRISEPTRRFTPLDPGRTRHSIWWLATRRWPTLAWVAVVQVLDGYAPIIVAAINRAVVDRYVQHAGVWALAGVWSALVVANGLLAAVSVRASLRVGGELVDELSQRVFDRLIHQSPRYHEHSGATEAHTVLTRGISELESGNTLLSYAISLVTGAAGALIALARIGDGWLLLGVGLLSVTLLSSWSLSRALARASSKLVEAEKPRTALVTEVFDAQRFVVIKRNVLEPRFSARFAAIIRERTPALNKRVSVHAATTRGNWTVPLLAAPCGWLLAAADHATLGEVVVVAALLSQTLFVAGRAGDFLGWLAQARPYLTRALRVLRDPLDDQPDIDWSIQPGDLAGQSVIFKSVHCTLGAQRVLRGVDLVAPPDSYTAIVGPNGAGKTTMLNIITGLLTADGGGSAARIGPFPIARIPRVVLAEHVRALDSTPVTFAEFLGTALEHVTLLRENATAEEIDQACAMAGIVYPLDRPASVLSTGEKMQMLVAQVVLARPRVLVLDEGLKHLHPTARKHVRQARRQEVPTVLEVIHDGAVRSDAVTNIVVMEDGTVVEQGTHQQLMRLAGRYASYLAENER